MKKSETTIHKINSIGVTFFVKDGEYGQTSNCPYKNSNNHRCSDDCPVSKFAIKKLKERKLEFGNPIQQYIRIFLGDQIKLNDHWTPCGITARQIELEKQRKIKEILK